MQNIFSNFYVLQYVSSPKCNIKQIWNEKKSIRNHESKRAIKNADGISYQKSHPLQAM